jgi:hypothetical protein
VARPRIDAHKEQEEIMTKQLNVSRALAAVVMFTMAACAFDAPTYSSGPEMDALLAKGSPGGPGGGGGGGGDEGFGNNLSWPVIFAEGRGLTGQVVLNGTTRVFANTGLRPFATTDAAALAELNASGILPFWWSGNVAAPYIGTPGVFWQKTANVWQAEWLARTSGQTPVIADWGDNLRSVKFATTSVIRVEHILTANDGTMLPGFPMDVTVNPSSPNEEQGIYADGQQTTTVSLTPTVFSDRARLKLQKLDGQGGSVTYTYLDKAVYESFGIDGPGNYSAEINVGGKVLFGYVWNMKNVVMPGGISKDGWWRITFSLDNGTGAVIGGVGAGDEALASWTPAATVAEIQIGTKRGGGKKP